MTGASAEYRDHLVRIVVEADAEPNSLPDWLDVAAICAASEDEYRRQRPEIREPRDPGAG